MGEWTSAVLIALPELTAYTYASADDGVWRERGRVPLAAPR